MLEIQLPKCIEARLCRFAKETGRSETALVKEALDHYLDDLEDIYFSDKVVQRIRDGREDVVSSEEMAQMLGLKSEGSRFPFGAARSFRLFVRYRFPHSSWLLNNQSTGARRNFSSRLSEFRS